MNKLKIPENHTGISKTLRLPENLVIDVENLSNLKNISFNKTITTLIEFALENLDDDKKLNMLEVIAEKVTYLSSSKKGLEKEFED